ncbi:MAG: insulinase family protein, partial [Acidobacteriota bacterium]|nr:insulinase family protein [Acidobacteriota bacterium]
RMHNLVISGSTFRNERQVVEEEARQRFGNQPYGNLMETLYAHAFTVSSYQHRPIGTTEDLDRASLSDVRAFYERYYVPNNATLVIVGKFDEAKAMKWIQQDFGPLEKGSLPIPRDYPREPPQKSERKVTLRQAVALPAFVEGYHISADGSADAYPLELAARILADGDSSWLYKLLVYKKQMAMQVECDGNFSEMPNLFYIFAVMNAGHTPAQGEAEVARLIQRLKDGAISEEDITRAKNEVLRDVILNRQSDQSKADALGYDAVILKDPNLFNTEIDRFVSLTAEDVARAAREYLTPRNMTLVEIYPKSGSVLSAGR